MILRPAVSLSSHNMQAIIIKYIQLFCVAVLFDNVSCDQILLKNDKDDLLFYQTTSCTASCLKEDKNMTLKVCYDHCESQKFDESELEFINTTNYKVKLLCRDDTSIVVKIVDEHEEGIEKTNVDKYSEVQGNVTTKLESSANLTKHFEHFGTKQGKRNVYLIKVEHTVNIVSNKMFYIAESPLVQIQNLSANTIYNITATIINSNFQYTNTVHPEPINTLIKDYTPEVVSNIHLGDVKLSKTSNKTLEISITWEPANDHTCHYQVLSFGKEEKTDGVKKHIITQPELLYQHTIRNLSFGSTYSIGVRALNTKYNDVTSPAKWVDLETRTCWHYYPNDTNLEICPAFKPENVVVDATLVSQDHYHMNISWDKPERQPRYYSLVINHYNNNNTAPTKAAEMRIQGRHTYAIIDDVEIHGIHYEVNLTAVSPGGSSEFNSILSLERTVDEVTGHYLTLSLVLYTCGSIFAVIVACVFVVAFLRLKAISRRRRDRESLDKHSIETRNPDKRLLLEEEIKKSFLCDGMEIDQEDIKMLDVIGEGAFGYVTRAILLSSGNEVAVKRLKSVATFDVMNNFCREVDVMRSVNKHPNIVGLIGHCMKDLEKMMMLTEYCSEGNLLDFLRNIWQRLMTCPITVCSPSDQKPTENGSNFGSTIKEINLLKAKQIHRDVDADLPDFPIENLIVNKLYDECNDNNFISKLFHPQVCSNSCKSYVDIIAGSPIRTTPCGGDNVKVSVRDCDCTENKKNKSLNQLKHPISIVENRGYDAESKINNFVVNHAKERNLTKRDLLSFALQIANGMEFLSLNKVIHRDLAARNVCVCSDLTVKIADFGLSRDVYQENLYKKSSDGKLPIKWLALESMTFQMYSSQSDVYELMLSCWKTMPVERPSFSEIKIKLERLQSEFMDDQLLHNKMFDENLRYVTAVHLEQRY